MLIVATELKDTKKYGLGIFSVNYIKEGEVVWQYNSLIDRKISIEEYNSLPTVAQKFLKEYSPCDGKHYNLDGDSTRHMNHSWTPNIRFCGDEAIAIRNIEVGEELTTDYSDFDEDFANGDYRFDII